MANASKNKGNSGERELCSIFSKIFNESFTRVPNSGAMIGGKNSFRKELLSENQSRIYKGDIIPPDSMPKLVVEVKWYKDFRFHQLLQSDGNNILNSWIEQSKETIDENDFWIVCFKINSKGWYIVVPEQFNKNMSLKNFTIYHYNSQKFIITELMEFLHNNKEIIKLFSK